jgi:type I restriction enzyme S subunit
MKFVTLGKYCTVRNGYAFSSDEFTNEGIPVIRISDVTETGATSDKAQRIKHDEKHERFSIKKNNILIAMSGATTGKFAKYLSDEKAYQNQRVGCFVIKDENQLDNDFLYYSLFELKKQIEKKAYGGAQPNISASDIENFTIPLPPLEEQKHIAAVLSKAEALIAERKQSIQLLDEYLKSTFLEMFGDPV